jgi:iron complex transport system substrate-binding protein
VTESLFAIGAGGQVVGRTNFCDYPEEVRKVPSIGGFSASSISVESIIALEPDLVIGGSTDQAEVIRAVEAAGIPAFVTQPKNLAEIMDALILFGQITGHQETAATVVTQMQTRIETVKEAVSTIPTEDRPTVFYEVWHEPLMSTSGKSSIGELIEIAGGINIFADLPDEYPTVNAEQILNADPDFIIGPSSHGDQLTANAIGAREGWRNLTAVKNNAIYIVDGNIISRPGPRMVDALEDLAHILHPDLFKK